MNMRGCLIQVQCPVQYMNVGAISFIELVKEVVLEYKHRHEMLNKLYL